jgi:hypothetical protein
MSNKFFAVFGKIVLVLVVLGVVGYGAYYFGIKSSQNQSAQTQTTETSATIAQNGPVETIETQAPVANQTANIIADVRKGLITEHGQDAASLNITVSKIEGDFASGGASEQGGGGMWFAAKVNGVWKLVWDGNGTIQCSSLASYPNFPTDMIPQCWNDKDQSVVKR